MKSKRLLTVFTVLCLCFCMMALNANAVETELTFDSFDELVTLVAENQTEYIGAVNYTGDTPLVIESDLHIPWTMGVGSHEQPVIVPEGVTLQTDNLFFATQLTVNGTMNAIAVEIDDSLTVNGALNVNTQVYLYHQDVTLVGEENIHFAENAILCLGYRVYSMDDLLEAVDIAAEDTNSKHLYSVSIKSKLTINKSLTLPDNFQLGTEAPVTIAAGCTLKTSYIPAFRDSVTVKGTLVNTNGIYIIHTGDYAGTLSIADGGSYTGSAVIRVFAPNESDPTVVLSGIDTSRFDIALDGSSNTWILTPKKLSAPTVSVSNIASSGKIKVSWNKVTGAAEYKVYRATSKNGTYSRLITTSSTSITNTSAKAGTQYYYYVIAIDANGHPSAKSSIVTRTCDLPQPKITLSNVASSGKVKISWDKIDGAAKYEVYRATSKTGTYSLLKATTGTSLTNTSTTAGKTYYYKVRAIHNTSSANSAYSEVKSRTCDLPQPKVTLSNVASSGKVKISWEKIDGAVKYEVYRATSKDGTYTRIKTTTGTSLTNTSTTAGKTYYYKVRAIHNTTSANSAYSEVKSRTCDLPRPTLTLKLNSKGKPALSWTKIDGAVSYKVYRATSKTGAYSLLKTTTGTSLTNTSAVAGKTYYYKVVAVCSPTSGNSAYSSIQSITSK